METHHSPRGGAGSSVFSAQSRNTSQYIDGHKTRVKMNLVETDKGRRAADELCVWIVLRFST